MKVLTNRLSSTLDEHQPPEQAVYKRGFSTIAHLHAVTQVFKKTTEYNIPLYMAFVHCEKAFDSIQQRAVFEALRAHGVQEKYINIIKETYAEGTAQLRTEKLSGKTKIMKGVHQGDRLSPEMFTVVVEEIFKRMNIEYGININGVRLSNLRFANDIIFFSESEEKLKDMLEDLNNEGKRDGMKLTKKKAKIMCNEVTRTTFGNEISKEIGQSITSGWRRCREHSHFSKNRKTPICLKRKIILPAVTYGAETWALTKHQEKKLAVAQRSMERVLLNIAKRDKIRNEIMRCNTGVKNIRESRA